MAIIVVRENSGSEEEGNKEEQGQEVVKNDEEGHAPRSSSCRQLALSSDD